DSQDVHLPLPPGPAYILRLLRVIEPFRRSPLDPQGVGQEACREPEGKDNRPVKEGQQNSSLKVADPLGEPLPGFPKPPQHITPSKSRIVSPGLARRNRPSRPSGIRKGRMPISSPASVSGNGQRASKSFEPIAAPHRQEVSEALPSH